MSHRGNSVSWVVGIIALGGVVWYFRPEGFVASLKTVGWQGALGWVAITVVARALYAEVPTRLLRALEYRIRRLQLYSIAWLRTFSNQIVPMTGIAVYLQQVRTQSGASWQDLAASSSQQVFISLSALGIVGVVAVMLNWSATANGAAPLTAAFAALACGAVAASLGVSWVLGKLPESMKRRITDGADSFARLAGNAPLISLLVGMQCAALVLRGSRLWLLFVLLGVTIDWREALLIIALAEATILVAVTPGGLGIREAIIIGGASLLGLPINVSVMVSLVDRLFVVVLAGAFAGPSAFYLYRTS